MWHIIKGGLWQSQLCRIIIGGSLAVTAVPQIIKGSLWQAVSNNTGKSLTVTAVPQNYGSHRDLCLITT